MNTTLDELLTVKDVATYCHLHEVTVRRYIAAGRLRSVRIGRSVRVRRDDLEAFIGQRGAEPESPEGSDASSLPPPRITGGLAPFTLDDPLWDLVGKWNNPQNWWVSSDKRRALAEAHAQQQ